MSAHLKIYVQTMEYPSEHDVSLAVPLSESLIKQTFAPIDMPSDDAGPLESLFCAPTTEIKKVKMGRSRMAKMLAATITDAILEAMGSKDTTMGYSEK